MGIKNLYKYLQKYSPSSVQRNNIKNLKNKIIGIDASFIIYKFVTAIRSTGKDLLNDKNEITSHLYGIFFKIIYFLKFNIIPIFVFDGTPPNIKFNNLEQREELKNISEKKILNNPTLMKKEFKKMFSINDNIISNTKKLLRYMNIQYIDAPGEADVMLAYLNDHKYTDGSYSDDTDILVFGGSKLYTKFDKYGNYFEIDLHHIMRELEINRKQFIILCLLLGTDYCTKIKGLKMKNMIIIIKTGNYNKFLKNECYLEAYNYYKNSINFIDYKININKHIQPKFKKLYEFMVEYNHFDKKRIISGFNKINYVA